MENSNVVHRIIHEVLVPKFEQLHHTYPNAQRWDVSILAYAHAINHLHIATFVTFDLAFGTKNPMGYELQCNPYNEAIFWILPKVDQILKDEQQNYGISVDETPLQNKYLFMHTYTKFNA